MKNPVTVELFLIDDTEEIYESAVAVDYREGGVQIIDILKQDGQIYHEYSFYPYHRLKKINYIVEVTS